VKQTAEDDVEAFLHAFETTATREQWPESQWADLIAPFLTGIAQTTYQNLTVNQVVPFDQLKEEILRRYGHTLITRAQRFHDWALTLISPRAQMYSLTRIANTWLLSEPHNLSPIDRIIMDKFLRTLPFEAKK